MRLCLAQINSTVGDIDGNLAKVSDFYSRAVSGGADIAIFPELALCGYPPEDLLYHTKFIKDIKQSLKQFAVVTNECTAVVGLPYCGSSGGLANCAAIIQGGRVVEFYNKILLPNYSVFDEMRYFTAGKSVLILAKNNFKIGISICEDLWRDEGPANTLAGSNVDIVVNLSASPYHINKGQEREKMFSSLCKKGKFSLAYCNLVGGQDELVFDGTSFVMDRAGKIIARAPQFKDGLLFADIELRHKEKNYRLNGKKYPVKLVKLPTNSKEKSYPPLTKTIHRLFDRTEEIYEAIVLGLRDYANKNGFRKVILGVSGGIDSALVAAIACDAFGKENVMGISMPTQFSSNGTKSDASRLCKNLGMIFREISIQPLFEFYKKVLEPDFAGLKEDLAEENLQARIRATILMSYSNKLNYLLLATGNKSEVSVGYSTLYGDMAGGFSPIKDITKDIVYALSRFVNKKSGKEIIPVSIIDREPSAELRHDQKDSDSLPPYSSLDTMLKLHIESYLDSEAICRKRNFEKKIVDDVLKKVRIAEYKRRQSAPGTKVTTTAFGKDRRMPITNGYKT